jgi:hypothetical protein
MAGAYDKITGATFTPERCGLHWVELFDQDDESGEFYPIWLLVQCSTDRVLVSIDGPTSKQICYTTAVEGHGGLRKYISLDGAKRNAIAVAMQIIGGEKCASSERRKARRVSKFNK